MTTQDFKAVNADFFESNLNPEFIMKKYAALPYGGLYVLNGNSWESIADTSEICHKQDAQKFLYHLHVQALKDFVASLDISSYL